MPDAISPPDFSNSAVPWIADNRAVLERLFRDVNSRLWPPYHGVRRHLVDSGGCTDRITLAHTTFTLSGHLVASVHIVQGEALAIALLLPFEDAQLGLAGLCDMSHLGWGLLRFGTFVENIQTFIVAAPLIDRALSYAAALPPR